MSGQPSNHYKYVAECTVRKIESKSTLGELGKLDNRIPTQRPRAQVLTIACSPAQIVGP